MVHVSIDFSSEEDISSEVDLLDRLVPRSEEDVVTGEIRIQIRYEKFDVSPST